MNEKLFLVLLHAAIFLYANSNGISLITNTLFKLLALSTMLETSPVIRLLIISIQLFLAAFLKLVKTVGLLYF